MRINRFIKATFLFVLIFLSSDLIIGQETYEEKHLEVALRMIGHQVLLNSGDSTSRVLPIEKVEDRYKIQLESEWGFVPDDLVNNVNKVVLDAGLADAYIVEVKECVTERIVYGFEMDGSGKSDIIPCEQRSLPVGCYDIFFTINDGTTGMVSELESAQNVTKGIFLKNKQIYFISTILLLFLTILFFSLRKSWQKSSIDPNLIPLGRYHFDKKNSQLISKDQKVDLSGKEADLLELLYNEVNNTVEREVILKMVWGDEGDYVGRTLDVFISKLRKKLDADSNLKIVNIRGVGYKLILNA